MTELTIEIPDKETGFVTEFVKKIGGKIIKQTPVGNSPNRETVKAMTEADAGKVKKFKTAKSAIEHLQKLTNV